MSDLIDRQAAIDELKREASCGDRDYEKGLNIAADILELFPSAQPEYKPVTAEDFAKTMSKHTLYSFIAWHGEALELMERQGFVICKKMM